MSDRSFKFGIFVSIIWIVGIFAFYLLGLLDRPTTFNELGDFLAGIFSPVAFLWLIYGYFQNSLSIQAQINEMKETVKQQEIIADIQKQQFIAMLNAAHGEIKILSKEMRIIEINDILFAKPETLYTVVDEIQAQINDLRNVSLEVNATTYESISFLKVDKSHSCELLLNEFNFRGDINKFLTDQIDECEFEFIIRYQNIYGAEKKNDYKYKFTREGGQVKVTKRIF